MPPEQSKRGRLSVACVICRASRRACDGKFADCAKYVPLPATASDATGPSQPASPPSSRPVRSKTSPGGSQHRGAPVSLAAEPAYAPVEEMRDRTDQRYDLKRRRTSEEAVGEQRPPRTGRPMRSSRRMAGRGAGSSASSRRTAA